MTAGSHRLLRRLPKVDDVLRSAPGADLLARYPRWAVLEATRGAIAERRSAIVAGAAGGHGNEVDRAADAAAEADGGGRAAALPTREALAARAEALLRPSLRRVLNATGVVLHTNLGRAPLAPRALARIAEVARGYSNLEYDPERRDRGLRHEHVAELAARLTGAEAAAIVNNNAGAVLVSLAALAAGRDVIVSRGELVEIGGGFRVPDVMRQSGARLREVGTTNKTRVADYAAALGADTALLLKVHRSNFAVVGFTEEASVADLAALGAAAPPPAPRPAVPVMVDLGSGALLDLARLGLPREPTVGEVVAQGAGLVTFSGDKLLGGPQAGIVVGRRDLVAQVLAHPLMRALRPDKLTLAAMEATLEIYRDGEAAREIPTLRMLAETPASLEARKERLIAALRDALPDLAAIARRTQSAIGGGALPLAEPETWAVALRHPRLDAERLSDRLAAGNPPLIARIAAGEVILDVRTLENDDLASTVAAVREACS